MKKNLLFIGVLFVFAVSIVCATAQSVPPPAANPFFGKWEGEWNGPGQNPAKTSLEITAEKANYKISWLGKVPNEFSTPYILEADDLLSFVGKSSGKKLYFRLLQDGTLDGWRADDTVYRAKMKRVN